MLKAFNYHIGKPNAELKRLIDEREYKAPWQVTPEPDHITLVRKDNKWVKKLEVDNESGEHVEWQVINGEMKKLSDRKEQQEKPF